MSDILLMLQQLHTSLLEHNPQHGLFISAFDEAKNLIFSQGSRKEPADEVLTLVYESLIANDPHIHTITLHIVTDVQPQTSANIAKIDPTTTGI